MQERTFAKKLRSLKVIFLGKVSKLTGDKSEKEKREIDNEQRKNLKERIAQECRQEGTRLKVLALAKDTNAYWKLWSKTAERGWPRFAEPNLVHNPEYTGRGKVELIVKKDKSTKIKTYLNDKEARNDITAVRQARRCELMVFRITLAQKPGAEEEKKVVYAKLNDEAISNLNKHQGEESWEKDVVNKLEGAEKRNTNDMMIPILKNAAKKYHEKAAIHRAKAEQEEQKKKDRR